MTAQAWADAALLKHSPDCPPCAHEAQEKAEKQALNALVTARAAYETFLADWTRQSQLMQEKANQLAASLRAAQSHFDTVSRQATASPSNSQPTPEPTTQDGVAPLMGSPAPYHTTLCATQYGGSCMCGFTEPVYAPTEGA